MALTVLLPPSFDALFRLGQRREPMRVQGLRPKRSVG